MYAVVRYFNYRKDVSFTILKTYNSFKMAIKYALECAQKEFGEDVVAGVSDRKVYIDSEMEGYTRGDGYEEYVYTVLEIPEPEDDDN